MIILSGKGKAMGKKEKAIHPVWLSNPFIS